MGKLVYGVGINDADYPTLIRERSKTVDGKRTRKLIWICPYFLKWRDMLYRCYSEKRRHKNESYADTYVVSHWLRFSNFKKWVDEQPNKYWQNCNLDKDLLAQDKNYYSPETCIFISQQINLFIRIKPRNDDRLIGVSKSKVRGKYEAKCNNPFSQKASKEDYLGYFNDPMDAHLAWKAKKHEIACKLAEDQIDPRVVQYLTTLFSPDKDWTKG
jgi:hypothetical protein